MADRYCRHHDEPVDHSGRCPECYRAADEYAEQERDTQWLWNTR